MPSTIWELLVENCTLMPAFTKEGWVLQLFYPSEPNVVKFSEPFPPGINEPSRDLDKYVLEEIYKLPGRWYAHFIEGHGYFINHLK